MRSAEGEGDDASVPILELWNKWDLLGPEQREELAAAAGNEDSVLPISAETGFGVEEMLARVGAMLTEGARVHRLLIPAGDGARIAWLHQHGELLGEEDAGEGEEGPMRRIEVRLSERDFGRFKGL